VSTDRGNLSVCPICDQVVAGGPCPNTKAKFGTCPVCGHQQACHFKINRPKAAVETPAEMRVGE